MPANAQPDGSAGRPLVVLDALLVSSHPTGVGRSILELIPALAEKDRGLDFLVLATEPAMFEMVAAHPGWRVLECPGARGGTLRKAIFTQWEIPKICARQGAALLHSMQFVAPWRLPCPSVVTVHDLGYRHFPETVEEPRRSYYRFLVPGTLNRAAAIVTNSQATADDTVASFPGTRNKITATLFGTPSWVWPKAEEKLPRWEGRPFFLFVGTLEPRKNLERLLAAYEQFLASEAALRHNPNDIPDLVLVGGKGWKDSGLREKIDRLHESGKLVVKDYCDTDQLWQLYGTAQALLFPSLHEGFGFPILEAMAAGLPVLTANRGAMREVGGTSVLAVDPLDVSAMAGQMGRLAWDEPLRKKLQEAGDSWARKWTWSRTADLTTSVYLGLLQGRQVK